MYDLLVTGGRCGVISMPSGVFKPYAGVSTAVLVFQKGGTSDNVWFYAMEADGFSLDDKRQKVAENDIPDVIKQWRKRHPESRRDEGSDKELKRAAEPKVGYDESDSSSRLNSSETRNDRKSKCFLVPADEIRANKYDLSISRYKQIEHKKIEYEKPDVIMDKVMSLEDEIANNIRELRTMLKS